MTRTIKIGMRPLTDDERRALERIVRARNERAERVAWARALIAVADGKTFAQAAIAANRRSPETVSRLVERWNAEGLEALGPGPAKPTTRSAGGKGDDSPLDDRFAAPSRGVGKRTAADPDLFVPAHRVALFELQKLDGFISVAIADLTSGMVLDQLGGDAFALDVAAEGNSEVVRAKLRVKEQLGISDDIEDILITLTTQYHLIRILSSDSSLFLYVVLDRGATNLGMARRVVERVERGISL